MRRGFVIVRLALVGLALVACGGASKPDVDASSDATLDVPVACALVELTPGDEAAVRAGCGARLTLAEPRLVDAWVARGALSLAGHEGPYVGPVRLEAGTWPVEVSEDAGLVVRDLGPPAPETLRIERSLTWSDDALLDDAAVVGLHRVAQTLTGGGPPGPMIDAMFRRFGTTAHSERLGPQRLLETQIDAQGADPTTWDLDAFPFRATGVHNRIDLADGESCGELRVSFASTHPLHQPFHLIFLFAQPARDEDRRPDGSAHCASTASRWARLSALGDGEVHAAARAILDEALTAERFVLLETLEFIISPWEWRQWALVDGALENPPLFQTVDAERLNRRGPDRDAFLAWVEENAAAIDARALLVPERFRAPSARVNDGVPWIPLDLEGVPAIARYPRLRQQLEMVGCPACHVTDAPFVQTLPDRSFSPFYRRELDARVEHLRALTEGRAPIPAAFGPLQYEPVLPP
ncbi:MAG: hypothetical protein KF901_04895 [Myxococcales bacterium]|nr:hypothetical protein [Myxococcales bacterium]